MSFELDQGEAEECYRERERLRFMLEEMITLVDTYSEWAPQWGKHRNQNVADTAMRDLLEEWNRRHPEMKRNTRGKRVGKFYVSSALIDEHPDDALKFMRDFLIVRCEYIYHREAFEYYAISRHFSVVELGAEVPEYTVALEGDEVHVYPVKQSRESQVSGVREQEHNVPRTHESG